MKVSGLTFRGHPLYLGEEIPGYSRFRFRLTGFYMPTGHYENPEHYMQLDEIGIGFNGNNPVYGPTYWSKVSTELSNATNWDSNRPIDNLMNGIIGTEAGKYDYTYNSGYKDTYYVQIVFDSLPGVITPTSIGVYVPNNIENHPQVPGKVELSGYSDGNWVVLGSVLGSQLTLTNGTETVVSI
jgi:hypothetical protein